MSFHNGVPHGVADERSPLLPRQDGDNKNPERLNDCPEDVAHAGSPEGNSEEAIEAQRQPSSGGQDKQLEEVTEVRKMLKYMFPALAIGVFLAALDQTIVASSYGRIGSDLDALEKTSWIQTSYLLTVTSFQPLYGKLSDIFSRKTCLLGAYLIFGFGCLGCGLAQDMQQLIAARAFAGVGGGGFTTVAAILLSDMVPLKDRGTWQGYLNIVFAAGASTGAPLGGLLADSIGWRWAFLAQAPLCLVGFTAVVFLLHIPVKKAAITRTDDWKQKLRRIDFLGAAVLIAAVFSLLLGLDRGSNVSWSTKACLIPLCLSLPLCLLLIYIENKVAAEPFAPGRVLFQRSLLASFLCYFFGFAGWQSALFYLPLYFQAVQVRSASQAGLLLLPGIVASVSGSLAAGFYMQRTGRYLWATRICYFTLVMGLMCILMFSGLVVDSTVGMVIGAVTCAFSLGIGTTCTLTSLLANAPRTDQAIAVACSYLFRSLGVTAGISLTTTVCNQTLRHLLHQTLVSNQPDATAGKIAEEVRKSLAYIGTLEPEVAAAVRRCYAGGVRAAFAFDGALMLGAALAAWFVVEKPLSAR